MSGSDLVTGTLDVVILCTLADGPLHGYAIGRAIKQSSSDVLSVGEGVLYPALHRLERKKFLAAQWGLTPTGREAKFYRVTKKGKKELTTMAAQWTSRSRAVLRILSTETEQ